MKWQEMKKAIVAGGTSLAGLEAFAVALDATSTHPWVHAAAVGLGAVAGFGTWIVRNRQTIESVFDAIERDPVIATAVKLKVEDAAR